MFALIVAGFDENKFDVVVVSALGWGLMIKPPKIAEEHVGKLILMTVVILMFALYRLGS
ncbi:hypothetical protein EV696_1212 [Permianibacter aggregans]|uniref:Uncharacterized protein n=2 Tax=Permianibacter aggregans TaxID=1510150 RepID=A0A4R6UP75_9GAMM|nr:hypothetical protein EV696_1212 [Permianibacter aggregans]